MASNARNRNRPPASPEPAAEPPGERPRKGRWLGRWVMALAIVAFLVVYVAQIARGSDLLYAVLFAGGAMAVAGGVGLALRQMLLLTAASERADDIVQQVEARGQETEGEGEGAEA